MRLPGAEFLALASLPSYVTPVSSPSPLAVLLLFALFSLLLEAQAPEISNQPHSKRGQAIDEYISKADEHNPVH